MSAWGDPEISDWRAFCKSCDMAGRYETAEEAEQACLDHHDETDHSDVWYGPADTANPANSPKRGGSKR